MNSHKIRTKLLLLVHTLVLTKLLPPSWIKMVCSNNSQNYGNILFSLRNDIAQCKDKLQTSYPIERTQSGQ